MGKLLLVLWIFLSSLFGISHPSSTPPEQNQLPNKLVITRAEDKADHLPAFTTITEAAKVRKLYEEIDASPTYVPGAV